MLKKRIWHASLLQLIFLSLVGSASAADVLSESFSSCQLPDTWTVDNLGGDCDWIFNSNRLNETGGEGCYALASSEDCGADTSMDTVLVTPSLDCSSLTGTSLSFAYDAYEQLDRSSFTVEISTNDGVDWTTVWQRDQSDRGPKTATVDLSAEADGQSSVLIRFHYTAEFDWWWQVDYVRVSADEKNTVNGLPFLPAILALLLAD